MSQHLTWDPLMIQRYNRAGPRYTSYPTAVEFTPVTSDARERSALAAESDKPLSLYFHIPFCRHVCYYCGCNKIVTKHKDRAEAYLAELYREIDLKAALVNRSRPVEQLHLGGGTPTYLSDDQLQQLMMYVRQKFTLLDNETCDYSIEIDPRELGSDTLRTLRELGFNRVSFGVQDLNERVQIAVNRVQPEAMIDAVMRDARRLGFRSINIDLIYGLPHQTRSSFADTLERIIDMRPDRLSIFNYAHLPERFMPQRRINAEDLPDAPEKLAIFGTAITTLDEAGYQYIGMDHFALPDDELAIAQQRGKLHRNFQGYTTHGNCDLIGFGVSSISQIGSSFFQNQTDLNDWRQQLNSERLPTMREVSSTTDDLIRKSVIMSLLCHLTVRFADLDRDFAIDSRSYLNDSIRQLNEMQQDGLVSVTNDDITITNAGRLMVRQACMAFDAYRDNTETLKFSKAI
ncbi:MAG: oxygen-independent coproporphyrinogen III oxidase [Oceanospirillaceae bacterium]|uniref:oxygen-independent coproporphyrinogen III oxidase n=1 Tax=unclassified Thalassolituus TaxID=2624967 RepID=UPI000B70DAB2|nr:MULTISPECIES: oxygen-independent coproporphyrinogen III oxidase [unclassified Thalassolituus]MAE34465.1 oxygen-independent coproporphyrinogen III oxidase [Oceanospirillaceae bacterium]OUX66104.1 MAG: oxygen-independent coproporphyrinogen III oxidase [Oceanospirillaceae bacterium TMED276]MBN57224.1 oxygen-independent coproporphyrinogen III oxidase [Oceanospirillaceae bacterium]MDQ4424600.1 oxygen-independent coproporphyrinogen III oxidase [Thalassolituus sp.]MDQ4426048.1 oxygen-independent c